MRSLESYIGRPVLAVKKDKVQLEGGVEIIFEAQPELDIPIEGKVILATIIQSSKTVGPHLVISQMGDRNEILDQWRVVLDPEYQIHDTNTDEKWQPTGKQEIIPPPDEPEGRTAEGPSQEWLDAQEKRKKAAEPEEEKEPATPKKQLKKK